MNTQVEAFSREREEDRRLALGILEALLGLREGEVIIQVKDGRVVEIERRERFQTAA